MKMPRPSTLITIALSVLILESTAGASAERCANLEATVEGRLRRPNTTGAHVESTTTIEVPLDTIDADDAEMMLRLRSTEGGTWVVDLMSAHTSAPQGDKVYMEAIVHLDFPSDGRYTGQQSIVLPPQSHHALPSKSSVTIIFGRLELGDDQSQLYISAKKASDETCLVTGQPDGANEVNGGHARQPRFYGAEEGLRAMLSEGPDAGVSDK